jgi:hypothetical protein
VLAVLLLLVPQALALLLVMPWLCHPWDQNDPQPQPDAAVTFPWHLHQCLEICWCCADTLRHTDTVQHCYNTTRDDATKQRFCMVLSGVDFAFLVSHVSTTAREHKDRRMHVCSGSLYEQESVLSDCSQLTPKLKRACFVMPGCLLLLLSCHTGGPKRCC